MMSVAKVVWGKRGGKWFGEVYVVCVCVECMQCVRHMSFMRETCRYGGLETPTKRKESQS